MKRRERNELYFEEIGDDFDAFMSDYDVAQRGRLVLELFPEKVPGRTLEVGCGTGAITEHYVDRVKELVLTDISEQLAVETAKRFDVEGGAEDALNLSFPEGCFDMVVSSECIEHTPDPATAVAEMMRVLKPGGHLVLTTPNRLWFGVVLIAQRLRIRKFQGEERFLSIRQLRRAIEENGGQMLRHTGCHLLPWQIPFIKPLLRRMDQYGDHFYRVMINQAVLVVKQATSDEGAQS
jgi:ubiquinone/menaquinone biosynthesis C-methylase UbiE